MTIVKLKQYIYDWINRHFTVKEKTPAVVIGVTSVAIGIAAGIFLYFYKTVEGKTFLISYDSSLDVIFCCGISSITFVILFLVLSGGYNLLKKK